MGTNFPPNLQLMDLRLMDFAREFELHHHLVTFDQTESEQHFFIDWEKF